MKIDQFLSKYKENITLVMLGGYYVMLASFSFLNSRFYKMLSENYHIDTGNPFDPFQKEMLAENEELINTYMPYLLAIGLILIVTGFIYKKIQRLILPTFLVLSALLIYWLIQFNQGTIQLLKNMQQFYEDAGFSENMPPFFNMIIKASQNQAHVSNYFMYLIPLAIATLLLLWYFPKKRKTKPGPPPLNMK